MHQVQHCNLLYKSKARLLSKIERLELDLSDSFTKQSKVLQRVHKQDTKISMITFLKRLRYIPNISSRTLMVHNPLRRHIIPLMPPASYILQCPIEDSSLLNGGEMPGPRR